MENSTMLNAMIQRIMTEESFLDRIGMSEQEMKTFLKEQKMREICVDLLAFVSKEGRFISQNVLKATEDLLNAMSPVPKEGRLINAYNSVLFYLFPEKKVFFDDSDQISKSRLFFLQLLKALYKYERKTLPFDPTVDFCLLRGEETDAGEYEEEYLKLLELSDTRYLYEFMRLGVDLTPFNTLGHIAGVHYVAMHAARQLSSLKIPVDLGLVSGAAAGHDIGKYGCKKSEEKVLYKDIIVDDMAEQDAKLKKGDEGYEQKVQRDEIRKAMKNGEGFEPLLQECYVLTGGKSVRVAGDVVAAVGVDSKQTYVAGYKTKEFTPMHLSVMDGGLDMVEYIYYMSLNYGGMEVFLADTTGKVNLLSGSQPQLDGLKLSENGKKAAYLDTDANTGDTILVEIELGKEKAETVATNVQSFGYIGNTLIYYFDYTEGVGTLGAAGSKTTIANASGVQFTEDAVYYVADADAATGNGELRAWDGKTETAIAKDVFAFQYKDNGKLVYIGKYDVNAGVGDLYYYDGKEARKLDTGVTAIFIY